MFDMSLPEIAALGELSARELVDAARGWARAENAACARKLAVMAEIFARRCELPAGERELWWVDPEAAVAAELAAALDVTQGLALHQTHRGVALRDRLPKVAALFEAGVVSDLLVRAIVWRTYLIEDEAVMAAVDAELAEQIHTWGPLSAAKTEAAIDALVECHDPGALRRSRESTASRNVEFGSPGDAPGFTSLWARLFSADAEVMRERLDRVANSVCEADPRGIEERRSDALAAIGAGRDELVCSCGADDCLAARAPRPARDTTVYIVAERAALAGGDHQEAAAVPTSGNRYADEHFESPPSPGCRSPEASPAFVMGAGVTPNALLPGLVDGARIREVFHPGVSLPEPRYSPSAALAAFVRCRDLTCRFPGCDRPASLADIDHTVPYPLGPTHPSNLKCLCRFHHLLKTFWNGPNGWRDRQLSDATVIWTSPTGHTYTTRPGSAVLFPALCLPTGELWSGDPPESGTGEARGAMMPRRRFTRVDGRRRTISAERQRSTRRMRDSLHRPDAARKPDVAPKPDAAPKSDAARKPAAIADFHGDPSPPF